MEYIIPAAFSNVVAKLIEQETYTPVDYPNTHTGVIHETASRITNEVIRLFFYLLTISKIYVIIYIEIKRERFSI